MGRINRREQDIVPQPEDAASQFRARELAAIYAHVRDVIFHLAVEPNDRFRFVFVNPAFLEVTGLTEDQVVGKLFQEVIPEAAHALVLGNYKEAVRTRKAVSWEEVSDYPTGRKYGEVSVAPICDAEGTCTHLVGVVHDITERQRTETALRESETLYLSILSASPDGIVITDLEGRFRLASPAAIPMFGHERPEEIVGRSLTEFLVPEDRGRATDNLARRLREVLSGPSEYRGLRVDGSTFPIEVNGDFIRDTDGRPTSMVFIVRDTTARKQVEAVLRTSEAMRDVAEEVAHIGSWRWQPGTQRASWSPGMYRLFDVDPGEFDGDFAPILDTRVHPEDRAALAQAIAAVAETGEPLPVEYRVVHRDGTEHIIHGDGAAEHDAAGSVAAIVGYYEDVTERRQAEAALRESEARYRDLFDSMLEGFAYCQMVYDEPGHPIDFTFLAVNRAVRALTGLTDVVGKRVSEAIPGVEVQLPELLETTARVTSTGRPERFEVYFSPLSKWLEVGVSTPAEGHFAAVFADITDRKRAEDALQQSEELYRSLFDHTLNGLAYCRMEYEDDEPVDFVYLAVNEAFETLTGLHDVAGKRVSDVLPGIRESDPRLLEIYSRVARTGKPETFEIYLKALQMWFSVSVFSTQPAHFVASFDVITERKQAEKELKASATRLHSALHDTVRAMGAIVELRDPYTAGHERQVTRLADAIALEMGIAAEIREGLTMAGEVHDIGKIGVPAEILSKPGVLTEIEFDLIKQHPLVGRDLLSGIDFERPVAETVAQHHERLDGSGYPDGLKGNDILLEARILAVADVVEAMASHRPYRPALGMEAALTEVRSGAAKLYDADAVAACERVIAAGFEFEG